MQPGWKKYLLYISLTIGVEVSILIVIRIIMLGYTAAWTGFGGFTSPSSDFVREKTLWDWMALLIVPFVLVGGAFYLNRSKRETERKHAGENAKLEREIATDGQQEAALQAYLDRMAELILEKNLRASENEEVRNVAKLRTFSVLERLDGRRRGMVVRFLKESALIEGKPIIDLNRANLERADLERADLQGANLERANLQGANLINANLKAANLINADLKAANLERADLEGTIMINAALQGANLERANLSEAKLLLANLEGAILIDADLKGADLERAELQGANLYLTNLAGARLVGANLERADLYFANLSEADLGGASLERANLSEARLSSADLSGANLSEADLSGASLARAKVTDKHLATARSLQGATMPDGTKHE